VLANNNAAANSGCDCGGIRHGPAQWRSGSDPSSLTAPHGKHDAKALPRFKELLERAIELDPKFGLAHSFLGMYYTMQANLSLRPAREVVPLAMAAD